MKKQELICFIKQQLNIELENDKDNCLNKKRKILYTQINQVDKIKVLSLLAKNKIHYEAHINNYYFIFCN